MVFRFLIAVFLCSFCVPSIKADEPDSVDFRQEVLPILSTHCFACHGFDENAREADLRLDTFQGASESALVPGKPEESELLDRVKSDEEGYQMPPRDTEASLTEKQVQVLRKWIAQGAEYEKHWSFEKPVKYSPPQVDDENSDHPIDAFIQKRLSDKGLSHSERAADETLIRRLSLDLIGLPPSVEEIDAFLSETSVDRDAAIKRLIDRLLESPHYGERWGRWWLDQARYADSNGYSIDAPRSIWKFRDWVVEAFNNDMPFDQFTVEQLAGDLLPDATQSQKIATGFHRNTQINQEGGIDKEQFRVDSVFDRVATTGTVWLGLTVGCAQCHDHKFDPILQKEYYQLFAFFNNQDEPTLEVRNEGEPDAEMVAELEGLEKQLSDFMSQRHEAYAAWESKLTEEEIKKLPKSARKILEVEEAKRTEHQKRELFGIEVGKIDGDYQNLLSDFNKLKNRIEGVAKTLVMRERKEPRKTTILIKGDFTRPSDEVQPTTPSVLHTLEPAGEYPNRLDLAHWIVSPDNPLTSRVIVNRVWQVYFGRGIVETENDFGTLGSPPSHPQLLDWLATEFLARNWSLKELHRLIVSSNTYQQSSNIRADLDAVDPNNYLLGRQTRLRLEAELIRDVSLTASGLLSKKFGGPPVYPPIPPGVMNRGQVSRKWNVSDGEDRYRRGLYTFVFRATPPPSLNVFDAPDGFSTCTRRARSNTPLQALTLLNDSGFVEFAEELEERIETKGMEYAFRACTGRKPTASELATLNELSIPSAARVLLNLDETVTRE